MVSRKERGESEGGEKKLTDPFVIRSEMLDRRSSNVRKSVLEAFVKKGFLPPQEVAHWRVPGKEEFLQPRSDEVVSFLTFHEQGLGYPAH